MFLDLHTTGNAEGILTKKRPIGYPLHHLQRNPEPEARSPFETVA